MTLSVQHVLLGHADDRDGALVFDGDMLVAVLCRLSPHHEDLADRWFVECLFGINAGPAHFETIKDACSWLETMIARQEAELSSGQLPRT